MDPADKSVAAAPRHRAAPKRWAAFALAGCGLTCVLVAMYLLIGERPASAPPAGPPGPANAPTGSPSATTPTGPPPPATPLDPLLSPTHVALSFQPVFSLDSAGALLVAWSPDGQTLATGQGNSVELWAAASGQFLRSFDVYAVSSLAWAPDSRLLTVGDSGNSIRVLDTRAGVELHLRPADVPATPNADAVWSPDGRLIASRFVDQPSAGTPLPVAPIANTQIARPVAPGGSYGAVRLWDPASGQTVRTILMPHHPEVDPAVGSLPVLHVAWAADGRYLATFSMYSDVYVWDPATGSLLQTLPLTGVTPYDETTPALAWQPGGHILAVIAGRVVDLWDADSGRFLRALPDATPPPPPLPTAIPTVPDPLHPTPTWPPPPVPTDAQGRPIIPPSPPPYLSPTPSPTYVYHDQGYRAPGGLGWAPDGRVLASFDGHYIRLWDGRPGGAARAPVRRMRTDGTVLKIAWSPDSGLLASLDSTASQPAPVYLLPGADQPGWPVATLRVWDPASGRALATILSGQVSDFAWAPDGRALAVRTGRAVAVWRVADTLLAPSPTPPPSPQASETPLASATPLAVCGAWSVVPVPAGSAVASELRGVAVGGSGEGWAVGYSSTSPLDPAAPQPRAPRALILHRNGRAPSARWEQVPSPTGESDSVLNGVAVIANPATHVTEAWAVGYAAGPHPERRALILHWDGQAWRQTPAPDVAGLDSSLNAVAGSVPNDVWAVGALGGRHTLVLHWDGTRWARVPSPSPGIDLNELTAGAAGGPGQVWVAGTYLYQGMPIGAPQGEPLVLRWDGGHWKPLAVPLAGAYASALAVLPDGTGWLAGGYDGEGGGAGALARLLGNFGQPAAYPPLGTTDASGQSSVPASGLSGLVGRDPADAWAVGHYSDAGYIGAWRPHTLTLHWDGAVWSRVPSPDAGGEGSTLGAVAAEPGGLWAVGHAGPADKPQALILRFAGPWCSPPSVPPTSPAATPSPVSQAQPGCALAWHSAPDDGAGGLNAVAVLPGGEAWAVGRTNGTPARTLIKRWDGTRWVQAPSPSVDLAENNLYGIAGRAANDIWAVGSYYTPSHSGPVAAGSKPLVLHWDGTAWRMLTIPDPAAAGGELRGVAALSRDDVWAAGYRHLPPGPQVAFERLETLLAHWDGRVWRIVPSPNPGQVTNSLQAIAGTASDDVWAVGSRADRGTRLEFAGDTGTLILHWDGKQWVQAPSPNEPSWINSLSAVSARTKDDIWAVGGANGGEHTDPLALHWDGKQWRIMPVPKSTSHNGGWLNGVAALARQDVWAVGVDQPAALIEHWNGRQWSGAPLPPLAPGAEGLFGALMAVAAFSPSSLWAVGQAERGGALTVRFSDQGCPGP
jgi:WD40 repeat protein